jgi:hypothetical protein
VIGPATVLVFEVASAAAATTAKSNIASTGQLWGVSVAGAEVRACSLVIKGRTVYGAAIAMPTSTAAQRTRLANLSANVRQPPVMTLPIATGVEVWTIPDLDTKQRIMQALTADVAPAVVP